MGLALSWGIQASHEIPLSIHFVLFETPYTATLSELFCTTKVPMLWRQGQYTVSYFSPTGVRHIHWENHASIQSALASGLQLVQAKVAMVAQPAASTNSTQSSGA